MLQTNIQFAEMFRWVFEQISPWVSKDRASWVLKPLDSEDEATKILRKSTTLHPTTQCHIPEVIFRCSWTEFFRLLGFYAAYGGLKHTFSDNLSVSKILGDPDH